MKKSTYLAPIAVALLLGGMASSAAAQKCRLRLLSEKGGPIQGSRSATFSARSTEDLKFSFFLSPATASKGEHVVSIRLRMPGGFLYQDFDQPVVDAGPDGVAAEGPRRVKGYPFPVEVAGLQRDTTESVGGKASWPWVTMGVPLAGTSIVQSSLYGEWIAEPYLDGEREKPCGRSLRFRIVE